MKFLIFFIYIILITSCRVQNGSPSFSDFLKKFTQITLPYLFEKEVEFHNELDSVMIEQYILKYDPNEAGLNYKDLKYYNYKVSPIGYFYRNNTYFIGVQATSSNNSEMKIYAFSTAGNYISKLVVYEHSGDCAFENRKYSMVDSIGIKLTSIQIEYEDCDHHTILKNDSIVTHYFLNPVTGFKK